MSRRYVTLLATDSYLPGTLVLWKSLQDVGARYPLVVVVAEGVSDSSRIALMKREIELIECPRIQYNEDVVEKMNGEGWAPFLENTATKLTIFNLVQFEKIVYLDSDMLVRKNVDWLFDRPHGSAAMDLGGIYNQCVEDGLEFDLPKDYYFGLNSGLLVLEPSTKEYERAMEILQLNVGYDQEVIRMLWPQWQEKSVYQLPQHVNVFSYFLASYFKHGLLNFDEVSIIHYVAIKPFMKTEIDIYGFIGFLDFLYLTKLKEAQNDYNKNIEVTRVGEKLVVIPESGFSWPYFKNLLKSYLTNRFLKGSTLLDVGCGWGTFGGLLRDHFVVDGLDIYAPHDNELTRLLYNKVFIHDIRDFVYDYYDVVVMGDIIEHLSVEDAQKVIAYAQQHSQFLVITVPYELRQEGNSNAAERHIQDDLTHEVVMERYPSLYCFARNAVYGCYFWRKKKE